MNKHIAFRICGVIIVVAIALSGSISALAVTVGDLAEIMIGESNPDANTLFIGLLNWVWECNDWDTLYALQKWAPYASVELITFTDNSNSSEYSEQYSFSVDVTDAVVKCSFNVSFDLWLNREQEEGEYYYCTIDTVSKKVILPQTTWVSSSTNQFYYESDSRPDGTLAMNGHFKSGDEWVSGYKNVSLYPIDDEWNNYPYGYGVSYNDAWKIVLYPDGTLYDRWFKVFCYPEGVEKQVKEIETSYGNSVGNSSSNIFNGCRMAMEGDVLITYSNGTIYRQLKNGDNKMGIYNNESNSGFACISLLDGECWFVREGEGAYGVTMDGRIDFMQQAKVSSMMVDRDGVFYTVYSSNYNLDEGVYCFDTKSGTNQLIYRAEADSIGVYGDWVYFTTLYEDFIYRVGKKGGEREVVSLSKTIGPFIVQDGILMYYTRDNHTLCYRRIEADDSLGDEIPIAEYTAFGGASAYLGSDDTKRVAFDHGWLYYYYNRDSSMICRRSLDGSVVDDFVCYTSGYTSGIYIFESELYLGNRNGEYYLAAELDNNYAPDYIVPSIGRSQGSSQDETDEGFFSMIDRLSIEETVDYVRRCATDHVNLWQVVNEAYHLAGSSPEIIFNDYGIDVQLDDSFYSIFTYESDDVYKCILTIGQFNDAETVEDYAREYAASNGYPDEDGWCTDVYACGRSLVTLMYRPDRQRSMYSDALDSGYATSQTIAPITGPVRVFAVAGDHAVGCLKDGTVLTTGEDYFGERQTNNWKDIIAVSASYYGTVGLRRDGTVVAVGLNDNGECDVDNWRDIIDIASGDGFTLGLKNDGTVVLAGADISDMNVSSWRDISAISASPDFQFYAGLKNDGTVVLCNRDEFQSYDTWEDIVAISVGGCFIAGLKSDGTIVIDWNDWREYNRQFDYSGWNDIIAIASGTNHLVGLKRDGTVIASSVISSNDFGCCDVNEWENITAITAGFYSTYGFKSDGTIVTAGDPDFIIDVHDWRDLNFES